MTIPSRHSTCGALLCALMLLLISGTFADAQGSLTPSGPPAPTMKTLDQVAPGTPIDSLPYTIEESGYYYLTGDLDMGGNDLTINISDVVIDLRDFRLYNLGDVWQMNDRVTIKNGTIHPVSNGYIDAEAGQDVTIEDIVFQGQTAATYALWLGKGTKVKNCRFVEIEQAITLAYDPQDTDPVIMDSEFERCATVFVLNSGIDISNCMIQGVHNDVFYTNVNSSGHFQTIKVKDTTIREVSGNLVNNVMDMTLYSFVNCDISQISALNFNAAASNGVGVEFINSRINGSNMMSMGADMITNIPTLFQDCAITNLGIQSNARLTIKDSNLTNTSHTLLRLSADATISGSTLSTTGAELIGLSLQPEHSLRLVNSTLRVDNARAITGVGKLYMSGCSIVSPDFEAFDLDGTAAHIRDSSISGMSNLNSDEVSLRNVTTEEMSALLIMAQTSIILEDCNLSSEATLQTMSDPARLRVDSCTGPRLTINNSYRATVVTNNTFENLDISTSGKLRVEKNVVALAANISGYGLVDDNIFATYNNTGGSYVFRNNIITGATAEPANGMTAPIINTFNTATDSNADHPAANYSY